MYVSKVGIIGAGTMGHLITELFAFNEIEVYMKDIKQEILDRGMKNIRRILDDLVKYHQGRADKEIEKIESYGVELTEDQKAKIREKFAPKVDKERAERIYNKIHPVLTYDHFADLDFVVEAATEIMPLKKQIFKELDEVTPKHVILASNTSTLPITEIGSATKKPDKVIGMHFFNPPHTLPLIEIIPALQTSEDTVNEVMDFCHSLRNHRFPMAPIKVKETPGFLVNRILGPMLNEAFCCYEEGIASPRDIDLACKAGLGFPMGPLELADMVGIDVIYNATKSLREVYGQIQPRQNTVIKRLYEAGYWGRKTGRGFYEYTSDE